MSNENPYRILIVDDIENNRFTLDIMLSVLGEFVVEEAESGQQALNMMSETDYDLVLLDIMMPGMTGLEVLETLDLANSDFSGKIIVVSALQDMETIVRALELGALDYLPKPIEEALLAARLKQLLERRDTDRSLIEHRSRIDADLEKAARIQLSLSPTEALHVECDSGGLGYTVAGSTQPAYEVGGDFYDYFQLPNDNLVLVIADACGKGAPAAIYATRVHDLLRVISRNQDAQTMDDPRRSLEHMVTEVNTILEEDNPECWFVTAWVGILSPANQQLSWCSSGHCEALLQSSDGTIVPMASEVGLPLGLDSQFTAGIQTTTLAPDSIVHLYTDGITEHQYENGAFIGLDGYISLLMEEIKDSRDISAVLSAIGQRVQVMNPTQSPADDITMLSLSYTSHSGR